ncbi:MAG: HAMP domain-containing sensor histidine kinase [Candidatus Peregrinibacteria bacterium]
MFRRISHIIALQFTAFVFLLFLVNGLFFLAADLGNARRQTQSRLDRVERQFTLDEELSLPDIAATLPPPWQDRIRITDARGGVIAEGFFLKSIPFTQTEGVQEVTIQNEEYRVLTSPIRRGGKLAGYMQIAELERFQSADLPFRILLYLLVSVIVSACTYVVGLFFARRSLQPAEEVMQRLGQFTQDASHELRTPLSTLSSSLDLALSSGKLREGLLSAKEDVQHATELVERMLSLARLDQFAMEHSFIDFSEIVRETTAKFQTIAQRSGLRLEMEIAEGITVKGDGPLLRQVVTNLVSNAIKFTQSKEHGVVRVIVSDGEMVVNDTGIGIAPADILHIFDRFFQADTSRAHGGYGLGLALVKRIVDLHGWKIFAESAQGVGTTFTVRWK